MKIILLLVLFVLSGIVSTGQYRNYNNKYDVKTYSCQKDDCYQPLIAGVLAIIRGAGHFYSGCYIGGLVFPAGMFVCIRINCFWFLG
ncbi:MAG: hypothetical protein L3J11_00205 [Draconibacterium sp.]|nr:hypothetical protein [Draconibacterium sp.]